MSAIKLDLSGMTKRFGANKALDEVSLTVEAGSVHALLGENGAGKSTLVKCLVGFYQPDEGVISIDGQEQRISSPKIADTLGIGMVYQHFTLVPSMTIAQNFIVSRAKLPGVINWKQELKDLDDLSKTLPFKIDFNAQASQLSAGEKQKAELLKQLYLGRRLLILDEPTSVLTPQEADQVLGFVRRLTQEGQVSAILITHKFDEVRRYTDDVTILRRGAAVLSSSVAKLSNDQMAEAMVGAPVAKKIDFHSEKTQSKDTIALSIRNLSVKNDLELPAVKNLSLEIRAGEIVGVAGVSGNGQLEMVEALMGQRDRSGVVTVSGKGFNGTRREIEKLGVYGLPQEPLKNACVARMSLAENLALRNFDRAPIRKGIFLRRSHLLVQAASLVQQFRVKTPGLEAKMSALSGGNVQRAVLGRELNKEVKVLIASNPTFGLDFMACDETYRRIVNARNSGAGVLLISEDLDELIGLADRVVVMNAGSIVYETAATSADRLIIGKHMAGSHATNG
ncbi:ABC transporter ATP-binding protein [Herbaspirillum robiniae]|uniref:ABC transporter ATP-binding protein n=1 Tax=Herbaspirillum robiniae TaxID=2014887 RepID=UPI003D784B43